MSLKEAYNYVLEKLGVGVFPNSKSYYVPPWYRTAAKEMGIKEVIGAGINERVVEYHQTTTLKAKDDAVPWCSAFVCWCLEKNGIVSSKSAAARSYLKWGKAVKYPYEGCIAVLARGDDPNSGHVGFFVGQKNGLIYLLGGNQDDAVNVMPFLMNRVLAFREPLDPK